jgi:hypothetical protein
MTIDLSIQELAPPRLQFGGASAHSDPKAGLVAAGPFDLRFGSARKDRVHVGLVGPAEQLDAARRWLTRCAEEIPALGDPNPLRKPFPGFAEAFHKTLVQPETSAIGFSEDEVAHALEGEAYTAFQRVLDMYAEAHARLASRDLNRPDVVLVCIPDEVLEKVSAVERKATETERRRARELERVRRSNQLDLFDMLDEVEETAQDFLKRDLRLALKAKPCATGCRYSWSLRPC